MRGNDLQQVSERNNECNKPTKGRRRQLTVKPFLCPDCPAPQTVCGHCDDRVPHRWRAHMRVSVHATEKYTVHPHGEEKISVKLIT